SAPIVPQADSTTLFTGSGMQPLIPYLLGQPHPAGKRLVNSQKSFRAEDIEEVGDNRHTTFFEMLGNWSLGDYFKEAQLSWFWQFLTDEIKLDPQKLYVSVFIGDEENNIPADEETVAIWEGLFKEKGIEAKTIRLGSVEKASELGMQGGRIFYYDVRKNWWSRSGIPSQMHDGEPGGPDSEVFYDFGTPHDLKYGKECHPNCDCGRFLEIGNSVFMQYQKQTNWTLKELPKKNVDFGGGLERIAAAANNDPDIFKTDLFWPIIEKIENLTAQKYQNHAPTMRIIADHLKAAVFMISEGLEPSNKQQGYVLRKLLRRAFLKLEQLGVPVNKATLPIISSVREIYKESYLSKIGLDKLEIVIRDEDEKFSKTMHRGMVYISKYPEITGKTAFNLFTTFGFPWELTLELAAEKGQEINRAEFEEEFKKHQDLSRKASAGMFKGGLADQSETVTKYHTATHLLQQALRDVLGNHVHQAGSNITGERLRFDFTHTKSLSPDEINKVEEIINEKINEDLTVTSTITPYEEAIKSGALAFFKEKYPEKVTVYQIGDYSKELCGGPHVTHTGEIGKIRIVKQESLGSGVRRIYLQLALP
ncbi:alanine--tRNA ligase, partial [Candidatus Collierbacteria bacterium]|nr:alanine--tRNA ligase [Candidatus Collierbacteria bacterium]